MRLTLFGAAVALVLSVASCAAAPPSEGEVAVRRIQREAHAGLTRRQIADRFERFCAYAGELLDASAAAGPETEKAGNCRLAWFDHLLRRPLDSLAEAEAFTRKLHEACCQEQGGLRQVLVTAASRLDAGDLGTPPDALPTVSTHDPIGVVAARIGAARASLDRAFAPLTDGERRELRDNLYEQSTGAARLGHRFADRDKGRRACDLLEKLDRRALLDAADALAGLTDPAFLRLLEAMPDGEAPPVEGASGALADRIQTPHGLILLGGRGANLYDLDRLSNVCAVVDLGGDDLYVEGSLSEQRPILVITDLSGDDTYRGGRPGIQGGAILGGSLLVDRSGNDRYQAGDVAQGSSLGGAGILIDGAGDDTYVGNSRVQGQAVGGVGALVDRAGNDTYRAALLAQGVGGPLGFGLLDDLGGADHYYAGGQYPGGYEDTPGYGSWSQGVGVGPRGVANGGIGVLLDGGGDDVYEYDYFGHAGGYWFAVGLARDFGGNDQRIGATLAAHDGSPRQQARFVRWGVGYGCHYALGFLFDDAGDDVYRGDWAAVGYAWDIGVGAICDLKGNDRYESPASGQAQAHNAALAIIYDGQGDDVYAGTNTAVAGPNVDYHPQDKAGGNFTFLIDYGGLDSYGEGLANNSERERGWAGGFFIDRPAPPAEGQPGAEEHD